MEREAIDWLSRGPRRRVSLTGVAHWSDGSSARVLISNISYQGCHIWCDRDLAAGETVGLTFQQGTRIEGQIRWIREGRAGIRFLAGLSATDDRRARIGV